MFVSISEIITKRSKADDIRANWNQLSIDPVDVKILDHPNRLEFTLRVPMKTREQVTSNILIPCKLKIENGKVRSRITLYANLTKPLLFSLIFGILLGSLFQLIYKTPIGSIAALIVSAGIFFGLIYYEITKRANEYLSVLVKGIS